MKEKTIQIRISEKQKELLKDKAEEQGLSLSEAIRNLIFKWVQEQHG